MCDLFRENKEPTVGVINISEDSDESNMLSEQSDDDLSVPKK